MKGTLLTIDLVVGDGHEVVIGIVRDHIFIVGIARGGLELDLDRLGIEGL